MLLADSQPDVVPRSNDSPGPKRPSSDFGAAEAVDIAQLADKVYRLMLQDVRRGHSRGEVASRREQE